MAWNWVYQEECAFEIYGPRPDLYRKGYVFSNYERFYQWRAFMKPFAAPKDQHDRKAFSERHERVKGSWKRRSEIWGKGGRG